MLDSLPLTALRAFEAAGRLGSFRAASQELGVTQGAVGQQVRGLEERLKTDLFERHPRGVRLTCPGARMHGRLQRAFRQMEDAVAYLQEDDAAAESVMAGDRSAGDSLAGDSLAGDSLAGDSLTGDSRACETPPVRLALPGDLATGWLASRRAALAAALPDLILELLPPGDETADLLLHTGVAPKGMTTVGAPLFESEIIAVVRPGVLAEGRGFGGVHLLHDSRDLWPDFVEQVLGMDRRAPLGGVRLDDSQTALQAALDGQGVALVERRAVRTALETGTLEQAHPGCLRTAGSYRLSADPKRLSHTCVRAVVACLLVVRETAGTPMTAHPPLPHGQGATG